MRNTKIWAAVGAMLLVGSAGVVIAGPFEKDATSKERGEYVGNPPARRATNRSYSYAPATGNYAPSTGNVTATEPAAPSAAEENMQQDAGEQGTANAQNGQNAVRSYSYQPAQINPTLQQNRRTTRDSRFFHAERKALGEY